MNWIKLRSWLEANQLKKSRNLILYFLFSHLGRALILVFFSCHLRNKYVKQLCNKLLRAHYHVEIACNTIGYRFAMPHPRNIIISAESIGNDVQVNQNVTIGGNMKKKYVRNGKEQKLPIIGNSVVIYTNAVVGGPCKIGDNVIIGSNCTCTHDVESNTLIYNKVGISKRKIEVKPGTYNYL